MISQVCNRNKAISPNQSTTEMSSFTGLPFYTGHVLKTIAKGKTRDTTSIENPFPQLLEGCQVPQHLRRK